MAETMQQQATRQQQHSGGGQEGTSPWFKRVMGAIFYLGLTIYLLASIDHVAWFFHLYEPKMAREDWWSLLSSYGKAGALDLAVFFLAYVAATGKAADKLVTWLFTGLLSGISLYANYIYAMYYNPQTQSNIWAIDLGFGITTGWLSPLIASSYPIFAMIFLYLIERVISQKVETPEQMRERLVALKERKSLERQIKEASTGETKERTLTLINTGFEIFGHIKKKAQAVPSAEGKTHGKREQPSADGSPTAVSILEAQTEAHTSMSGEQNGSDPACSEEGSYSDEQEKEASFSGEQEIHPRERLGFIERSMYDQLTENTDVLTELLSMAETMELSDLTSSLQQRYPDYASYITESRVASVWKAVKAEQEMEVERARRRERQLAKREALREVETEAKGTHDGSGHGTGGGRLTRRKPMEVAEVARAIGCTEKYVRDLRNKGILLPAPQDRKLITVASINAYLEERQRKHKARKNGHQEATILVP